MKSRVLTLFLASLLLFTGCGDSSDVTHNLISSDSQFSAEYEPKKAISEFQDLYPEDTRSEAKKLLDKLESESTIDFNAPSVDFFIGDFSIVDITPLADKIMFFFTSEVDLKNLQIVFQYDDGSTSGITVKAVPAGYTMQLLADMPGEAKKICVRGIDYDAASIHFVGDMINITESDDFNLESNNTISFRCESRKRYFVFDSAGIIIDDVTLYGSDSFVTGNGPVGLQEVRVKDGV